MWAAWHSYQYEKLRNLFLSCWTICLWRLCLLVHTLWYAVLPICLSTFFETTVFRLCLTCVILERLLVCTASVVCTQYILTKYTQTWRTTTTHRKGLSSGGPLEGSQTFRDTFRKASVELFIDCSLLTCLYSFLSAVLTIILSHTTFADLRLAATRWTSP